MVLSLFFLLISFSINNEANYKNAHTVTICASKTPSHYTHTGISQCQQRTQKVTILAKRN